MKFFPEQMRTLTLVQPVLKKNAQDEKRLRLDFSMLLNAANLKKAHDAVNSAFELVAMNDSGASSVEIAYKVATQKIEFYATPTHKNPNMHVTSAELRGLCVARPNAEKHAEDIFLEFTTTVPMTKRLLDWAIENWGATVFATFVDAQMSLMDAGGDADEPTLPLENKEAIEAEG